MLHDVATELDQKLKQATHELFANERREQTAEYHSSAPTHRRDGPFAHQLNPLMRRSTDLSLLSPLIARAAAHHPVDQGHDKPHGRSANQPPLQPSTVQLQLQSSRSSGESKPSRSNQSVPHGLF